MPRGPPRSDLYRCWGGLPWLGGRGDGMAASRPLSARSTATSRSVVDARVPEQDSKPGSPDGGTPLVDRVIRAVLNDPLCPWSRRARLRTPEFDAETNDLLAQRLLLHIAQHTRAAVESALRDHEKHERRAVFSSAANMSRLQATVRVSLQKRLDFEALKADEIRLMRHGMEHEPEQHAAATMEVARSSLSAYLLLGEEQTSPEQGERALKRERRATRRESERAATAERALWESGRPSTATSSVGDPQQTTAARSDRRRRIDQFGELSPGSDTVGSRPTTAQSTTSTFWRRGSPRSVGAMGDTAGSLRPRTTSSSSRRTAKGGSILLRRGGGARRSPRGTRPRVRVTSATSDGSRPGSRGRGARSVTTEQHPTVKPPPGLGVDAVEWARMLETMGAAASSAKAFQTRRERIAAEQREEDAANSRIQATGGGIADEDEEGRQAHAYLRVRKHNTLPLEFGRGIVAVGEVGGGWNPDDYADEFDHAGLVLPEEHTAHLGTDHQAKLAAAYGIAGEVPARPSTSTTDGSERDGLPRDRFSQVSGTMRVHELLDSLIDAVSRNMEARNAALRAHKESVEKEIAEAVARETAQIEAQAKEEAKKLRRRALRGGYGTSSSDEEHSSDNSDCDDRPGSATSRLAAAMAAEEEAATAAAVALTRWLVDARLTSFALPLAELGVVGLADLLDIPEADLKKMGMTAVQRNRFYRYCAHIDLYAQAPDRSHVVGDGGGKDDPLAVWREAKRKVISRAGAAVRRGKRHWEGGREPGAPSQHAAEDGDLPPEGVKVVHAEVTEFDQWGDRPEVPSAEEDSPHDGAEEPADRAPPAAQTEPSGSRSEDENSMPVTDAQAQEKAGDTAEQPKREADNDSEADAAAADEAAAAEVVACAEEAAEAVAAKADDEAARRAEGIAPASSPSGSSDATPTSGKAARRRPRWKTQKRGGKRKSRSKAAGRAAATTDDFMSLIGGAPDGSPPSSPIATERARAEARPTLADRQRAREQKPSHQVRKLKARSEANTPPKQQEPATAADAAAEPSTQPAHGTAEEEEAVQFKAYVSEDDSTGGDAGAAGLEVASAAVADAEWTVEDDGGGDEAAPPLVSPSVSQPTVEVDTDAADQSGASPKPPTLEERGLRSNEVPEAAARAIATTVSVVADVAATPVVGVAAAFAATALVVAARHYSESSGNRPLESPLTTASLASVMSDAALAGTQAVHDKLPPPRDFGLENQSTFVRRLLTGSAEAGAGDEPGRDVADAAPDKTENSTEEQQKQSKGDDRARSDSREAFHALASTSQTATEAVEGGEKDWEMENGDSPQDGRRLAGRKLKEGDADSLPSTPGYRGRVQASRAAARAKLVERHEAAQGRRLKQAEELERVRNAAWAPGIIMKNPPSGSSVDEAFSITPLGSRQQKRTRPSASGGDGTVQTSRSETSVDTTALENWIRTAGGLSGAEAGHPKGPVKVPPVRPRQASTDAIAGPDETRALLHDERAREGGTTSATRQHTPLHPVEGDHGDMQDSSSVEGAPDADAIESALEAVQRRYAAADQQHRCNAGSHQADRCVLRVALAAAATLLTPLRPSDTCAAGVPSPTPSSPTCRKWAAHGDGAPRARPSGAAGRPRAWATRCTRGPLEEG